MHFKLFQGLEVIHHRADSSLWSDAVKSPVAKQFKSHSLSLFNDLVEDDDLDYEDSSSLKTSNGGGTYSIWGKSGLLEQKNKATTKLMASSHRQTKIYLNNITVFTGDLVRLQCPYAHQDVTDLHPDAYFSTKTVNFKVFKKYPSLKEIKKI